MPRDGTGSSHFISRFADFHFGSSSIYPKLCPPKHPAYFGRIWFDPPRLLRSIQPMSSAAAAPPPSAASRSKLLKTSGKATKGFCVSRSALRKKSMHGVLHKKHYVPTVDGGALPHSPNSLPIHPIVLTPTASCAQTYRAVQASSSSGSRGSTSSLTATRNLRSEAGAATSPRARGSTWRCREQAEWSSEPRRL